MKKLPDSGILRKDEEERFSLGSALPDDLLKKIKKITTRETLSAMLDTIYSRKIEKDINPDILISLFVRSGRDIEAGRLEFDIADHELSNKKHESAQKYFMNAIGRLKKLHLDTDTSVLFISCALKLSNLCFILGRDINVLGKILIKAQDMATRLGDKRSQALINFHIGLLYYFTGHRDEALAALSIGMEEVSALGDEDILTQSVEFMGLYYSMKGQFVEAQKYLERAENQINTSEESVPPLTYLLFIYNSIYLGEFHRAIGSLDSSLRLAEEKPNKELSSVLRSILGTTLVMLKKYHEAEHHLKQARKEALETENVFSFHFSGGGLALLYFMEGKMEESYRFLSETYQKATRVGIPQQYSSPWILEISYELHRLGFKPITGFGYYDILNKALNGANIHLRGVALRLRAQQKLDKGRKDKRSIMGDLEASKKCLEQSGNQMQVAKSILEMARIDLIENNKKKACSRAQEAWQLFGNYAQNLFPDQYKGLLDNNQAILDKQFSREDFLQRYFDELDIIKNSIDQSDLLTKTIISTNRFLGAERGGLFWFPAGKFTKNPKLRAVSNLTKEEVESPEFKPYMDYVLATFRTNKPLVIRKNIHNHRAHDTRIRSILCIPITVQGMTRGVLYHDNSYLQDAFEYLDPGTMTMLSRYTSDLVDSLLNTIRIRDEKEKLSREKIINRQDFKGFKLIAKSRVMVEQMAIANQAASTNTTVLVMGETGTGKGLFARWIHENSLRADGPFIVVDCATIPENLFESELFGYEKGAFTGADKQKLGRIEMAHEGTLFLDEIGELSMGLQTKLLKAIDEKTFVRIGGGRPIKSDFRLIAATNRELKEEVSAGRFREDLYYRLNIFPISIPPMRERDVDILELAHLFTRIYSKEYGRSDLTISKHDENMLMQYTWPGNVRELQNVIERAIILSKDDMLHISLTPSGPQKKTENLFDELLTFNELQRKYIQYVLNHTQGRISGPGGGS